MKPKKPAKSGVPPQPDRAPNRASCEPGPSNGKPISAGPGRASTKAKTGASRAPAPGESNDDSGWELRLWRYQESGDYDLEVEFPTIGGDSASRFFTRDFRRDPKAVFKALERAGAVYPEGQARWHSSRRS